MYCRSVVYCSIILILHIIAFAHTVEFVEILNVVQYISSTVGKCTELMYMQNSINPIPWPIVELDIVSGEVVNQ